MASSDLKINSLWLAGAVLLTGCSTARQQPELDKLHRQVGTLNSEMRQLTTQAASLEQQNRLNSGSATGAWLLPATHTGVQLKSQPGEVFLSLSQVESDADGTRVLLQIRAATALPAFRFQIEWGEIDATTGKPLEARGKVDSMADALLPRSTITLPLRLSNITPEQLGYVRVHNLVVKAPPQVTAP